MIQYIEMSEICNYYETLIILEKKSLFAFSSLSFKINITYACISHNCFYRSIHPRKNKQNSPWVQEWTRVSYIAVYKLKHWLDKI